MLHNVNPETVKFYAEEIADAILYCEETQGTNESAYTKEQVKIAAYNEIVELLNSD